VDRSGRVREKNCLPLALTPAEDAVHSTGKSPQDRLAAQTHTAKERWSLMIAHGPPAGHC
jgi:hypothetical protein